MRVRNVLFSIIALAAVNGADPAMGQKGNFVVDGDPGDWAGGPSRQDEYADVVPDTNSTVDVIGFEFGSADVFNVSDTLFTFLFAV